jgi:large subunit ribosomal protein L10
MDRVQKKEAVENLGQIFTESGSVVVARYAGLTVAQLTDLRRRMGAAGAKFTVIKNRLAKIALENAERGAAGDFFSQPTGIAYAKDPVAAAKVAAQYAKENEKFVIVGGLLGKTPLTDEGVKALASMPSMEELRSKLLGCLNAPASKLVRTLNAPASSLLNVLEAHRKKMDEPAAEAA